jgi:acyl-CoA reductase-like NAD-dependent aldehyde dehydrogenase
MIGLGKLVPALLAGCTIVLKPALETALDGQLLAQIVADSAVPAGVVSVLPADVAASERLVSHRDVDMISFTGSSATGRRIASIAAERFARIQLELGGKSAEIIMPDADITGFVQNMRRSSYSNNGQICTSHTRILAARECYDEVVDVVGSTVARLRIGNPADPNTEIGPLANARQYETVSRYIQIGVEEGARVVAGGPGRPDVPGTEQGYYVKPTVFADANNAMRIAREEIFGPVLTIIPFDGEAEAIRIANDSPYGLSGGVWTADPERGLAIGRAIRTGRVKVNGARPNFNAPFGGFKCSGIGREYGLMGLGEYTEYKVLAV